MPCRSTFERALGRAFAHACDYLNGLDARPVSATVSLEELRRRIDKPIQLEGKEASLVVDELAADVDGGLLGSAGGRFFAWVIGGSLPAALAADWLTSAWDQNAALYTCSPAEAVIEEVCGRWLKELLRLPATSSFALTTGCQMAHFTCLAAARNSLLARRGWDVERSGLSGAPRIRVLSSSQRHGSVERALRFLGIGSESITDLDVDNQGRLESGALEEALRSRSDEPTIVVLCAGDINIGAYDDFDRLIPIAHAHGAWTHVDGAFGLWANASQRLLPLLRGVEAADSWATDGHKWLNVPFDAGYAFVADASAHRASMSHRASYLTHADEARDEIDWNPEWSRRGRGVATYAAIRELGRLGVARQIERCCEMARDLVARLGTLPGVEVLWMPQINQGLVRFPDGSPRATPASHDANTDAVIARIVKAGRAFFGGTTWRGMRCMRVSVCNWRTSSEDVDEAVAAVRDAVGEGHGKASRSLSEP